MVRLFFVAVALMMGCLLFGQYWIRADGLGLPGCDLPIFFPPFSMRGPRQSINGNGTIRREIGTVFKAFWTPNGTEVEIDSTASPAAVMT